MLPRHCQPSRPDLRFANPFRRVHLLAAALVLFVCILPAALRAETKSDPTAKLGGMKTAEAKAWWAFQPLPKAESAPTPAKIDAFLNRHLEVIRHSHRKLAQAQRFGLCP